jgi:protein involved in polysaccharide export with SLBB domain
VLLQEFDVITLYAREELREVREVRVHGVVGRPGTYSFSEGMTVRDLLLLAGGLRDGAYLDTVEIARLPRDRSQGQIARTIRLPLDSSYLFEPQGTSYRFLPGLGTRASGTPEILLEPFDRVTILRQPAWEMQRMVEVQGEVVFPASYALRTKEDRLSSLINRAGGVTAAAFVQGARLLRMSDSAGPVDIDLEAALRQPGSREDLIIRPGDVVVVPEFNAVVKVQGAVTSPTAVQYREGASLSYYIANAGGYARNADRQRVFVRYANGSAETTDGWWFTRRSPRVGPGTVVSVPTKPDAEPFRMTEFLAAAAQILASTVAIAVIATR